MKRKIFASFILLVFIFTNYVFATNTIYPRTGGDTLRDHATIVSSSNSLYLPSKFNAKSIKTNDVEIYYSNGDKKEIDYSDSHFINEGGFGYYSLKFDPDTIAQHNITFKFKNALKYGNEKYNVKIVIGDIRIDGGIKNETTQPELRVRVASTDTDEGVYPHIYIIPTNTGKVEVDVDYYIYKLEDNEEKNVKVSGVLELIDVDLQQGIVIGGYKSTRNNTYIKEHTTEYLNVESTDTQSHFFSTTDNNFVADDDVKCDVYLKMEDFSHGRMVFTFDQFNAGSNIVFANSIYKNYHTITTRVDGGTITPTIENITEGESKTVEYAPSNDYSKYLELIKVDNEQIDISNYPDSYTFSDITADHDIYVLYGNKYKVQFVSNCDTNVPNQFVMPAEKATEPAEPTKEGYTFKGWYIDEGCTTPYDFDTIVNEDKILYAKWEKNDVYHNISYEIIGTPNDNNATNPDKYKEGDTTPITINNPTKDGYTFSGWYENQELTGNPVTNLNVSNRNTDITLYGKWTENEPVEPEDVYHNINYIIDGTPDNSAGNPERYKEGSTTPLSINNPTKTGYSFSGWYDNQTLSGNAITTLDVSNKTTDITLYGKWTKNAETKANYTVNHYVEDANGTITKDNKKYKLDSTQTKQANVNSTVTENAQSYEGYEAQQYTLNGTVTEDGSLELDFYYNKKQYTITFDTKGGSPTPNSQTKEYGEKVTEPTAPTKDGYIFQYWYEEKDGKKVIYDFNKPVDGNKELIAEWEEIKIVPDNPKTDSDTKQEIPAKSDTTTSQQTTLPKTGTVEKTVLSVLAIAILGIIFGIRYRKLRDIK